MVALADWKDAPGPNLIQPKEMSVLTYGVGQQPFRLQIDTNIGVIDLRENLYLRMEPFSLIADDHSSQLFAIALVDSRKHPSAPDELKNQDPEQPKNCRVFATGQTQKEWQVEAGKTTTTSKSAPTGKHPTAHATRNNSQTCLMQPPKPNERGQNN